MTILAPLVILLTPMNYNISSDLMWQRVGLWGPKATREAREAMHGIIESPSGQIRIHRRAGRRNATDFLFNPKADGVVYVTVGAPNFPNAPFTAIGVECFISRRSKLSVKDVVAAMRMTMGL